MSSPLHYNLYESQGVHIMTYQVSKAFVRPKDDRRRIIQNDDIKNKTYRQITDENVFITLELYNTQLDRYFIVEFENLDDFNLTRETTLDEYLSSLVPNSIVNERQGRLETKTSHVRSVAESDTDFIVEPASKGKHPTIRWPESVHKDIRIYRDDYEYEDFKNLQENTLFFINGFAHRSTYDEHGVYVLDANITKKKANEGELNMLDFHALGGIEEVDINSDMLFKIDSEEDEHYNYAYLEFSQDLTDKTILLSLGGYLHVLDTVYHRLNNHVIQINFNRYPFVRRYFESNLHLDLSNIEYTPIDTNDYQRYTNELISSQSTIKQFLDLVQSFAIIIDSPFVFSERTPLEHSHLQGLFYSHQKLKSPIQIQRGRIRSYRQEHEQGIYAINLADDRLPIYHFNYNGITDLQTLAPWKNPHQPYYHDRAHVLEIGLDILKDK